MFAGGKHLDHYRRHGYAVVRCVFSRAEINEMAGAFDRVYAEALNGRRIPRNENVGFQFSDDPIVGKIVRIARWPSYTNEVLDQYRADPRLIQILEPLIGRDIKQVVNQLHWKPAGAASAEFGYHQDIGFRRPLSAYRSPASSYVQTAIAIDPHRSESGAIRVYPGSQHIGRLVIKTAGRVMDRGLRDDDLRELDLFPERLVDLVLEPGDIALWNLYTIHGSGYNASQSDRRAYINGYVKAQDCDLGEWAFRDGQPVRLNQ